MPPRSPQPLPILEGPASSAQLAALLGCREQAVEFLRDAFARGLSMSTSVRRQMDFETLRGFAPFDDLIKPKG